MRIRTIGLLGAAAVLLALMLCGCMEQKLASTRLDRAITIDGKNPEWAGAEAYYDEEQGIKIGLSNDDQYLYVYLATWHRQLQRQILMNGLTIWFDSAGGKGKTFGVQYPLEKKMGPSEFPMGEGAIREGAPGARRGAPDAPGGARDTPRTTPDFPPSADASASDPKILTDLVTGARRILAIICPAEGAPRSMAMPDSSSLGIEAMIGYVNRTLIYELRVPLKRSGESGPAIGAEPGREIGIGFIVGKREMPDFKRPEGGPPQGMDEPPGGMGGPPGGMGGFPGGGRGGMRGGSPMESLEFWTKVRLAVKP